MNKLSTLALFTVTLVAGAGLCTDVIAQPKGPAPKTPKKTPAKKDDKKKDDKKDNKTPDKTPVPDKKDPVPEKALPPAPDKPPEKPDDKQVPNTGTTDLSQSNSTDRPWAVGVSDAEQKKALEIFREGNKDLNDGVYANAAKKYRDALVHWKHPAIHYNLALALLNLDQPLELYENLVASTKYGDSPITKEKFDKAKELIKVLEASSIATIEVTCSKPGGVVVVDGKKVFVAPGKHVAKVKAGKHVFTCEPGPTMEGYTTKIRTPYVDPGATFRVDLKLYTTDELTRFHRRWQRTWAPYVVVGAGVLAAGIGGLLALSAQSSYDDFDKKISGCNSDSQGNGCDVKMSGFGDLRDSGDLKRTASYVAYGVGGGAVVLGLTLAYLNRKTPYQIRGEEFEEEQEKAATPGVSVAPMITPSGGAGAMIFGRF